MFQEFFTDTLVSRFIKRLLRSTNLPLIPPITDTDKMCKDRCYIYRDTIIKCTENGVTPDTPNSYVVVCDYDRNDTTLHYNYHSRYMYYDSDTHYHLGEYLRYLKCTKNTDLMPYYNCFNFKVVSNIHLDKVTKDSTDNQEKTTESKTQFVVQNGKNDSYKVVAVPVKFGKFYTIAIDCSSIVSYCCAIYDDDLGNLKMPTTTSDIKYYSDCIKMTSSYFSSLDFTHPQCVEIPVPDDSVPDYSKLVSQEKNLYLVIQLPSNNTSSIVVLEGDYRHTWTTELQLPEKLSLLYFNCRKSFAFSDRLLEYLLLNVIDQNDSLTENIAYIQSLVTKVMSLQNSYLSSAIVGEWDKDLDGLLHNFIKVCEQTDLLLDQDGNVNKDLERELNDFRRIS